MLFSTAYLFFFFILWSVDHAIFVYLYSRQLRLESQLGLQCRGYICALYLRNLSPWYIVSLVICFEQKIVTGGNDSAFSCAATMRLKKSEKTEATNQHLCEDQTVIWLFSRFKISEESLVLSLSEAWKYGMPSVHQFLLYVFLH